MSTPSLDNFCVDIGLNKECTQQKEKAPQRKFRDATRNERTLKAVNI